MIQHNYPKGIVIFSALIVLSSIVHMQTLAFDFNRARGIYQSWPEWLFLIRICFSWFMRIAGLSAGIGIFFKNNFFRKLAMLIGAFTIATVYWKHPYDAFLAHNQMLDNQLGPMLEQSGLQEALQSMGLAPVSFASYTVAAVILHCLLDIAFWSIFIYYFTRPSVKAQFHSMPQPKSAK